MAAAHSKTFYDPPLEASSRQRLGAPPTLTERRIPFVNLNVKLSKPQNQNRQIQAVPDESITLSTPEPQAHSRYTISSQPFNLWKTTARRLCMTHTSTPYCLSECYNNLLRGFTSQGNMTCMSPLVRVWQSLVPPPARLCEPFCQQSETLLREM